MKCLLLDVGSTFIKYSFYETLNGKNSEIFRLPFPEPIVNDGIRFEVSRKEIDSCIMRVMNEAHENACKKAFICVQMHGYFLKNEEDFSNYISWRDCRGNINDKRLSGHSFSENGTSLKCNLPAAGLCTFDVCGANEFFTLGSYICAFLTGINASHKTDACASGFYNRSTLEPDTKLFPGLKLPKVFNELKPVGRHKDILIYTPVGDHQTSFLGSGAGREDIQINVGTAIQLTAEVPDSFLIGAAPIGSTELRPYFSGDKCLLTVTGIKYEDSADYINKITDSLNLFGNRKRIIFGGGGAEKLYKLLNGALKEKGYFVIQNDNNIGNEGLKEIARSSLLKRGTMLSEVPFVNFPIIMKRQELDFIIVDDEHGSFENQTVLSIAENAGFADIQLIVRLPDSGRALITKLADGGVRGFLLPMTNSPEDIKEVIKYAKYRPIGCRGISTSRAHTMYGIDDLKQYMSTANEKMKIYAQIETVRGVSVIEEILSVDGLEGVFIGPNDLSDDAGCIGDNDSLKKYIEKICAASVRYGKPCGIITTDLELLSFAVKNGASMISVGSEINMLKDGAVKIKNILTGLL